MTFKVGDTIRTTKSWNSDFGSTGTVVGVTDEAVFCSWPDGCVGSFGSDLFEEPGRNDLSDNFGWTLPNPFLTIIEPAVRGILPGDRVIIGNYAGYGNCTGTVTYSKDKVGPVVLITDDPFMDQFPDLKATGERVPVPVEHLSRVIPQAENNLHEALDDVLFNV